LISGIRWSIFEIYVVNDGWRLLMNIGFLNACRAEVWWIFKKGYRLKA
jgi:ABC-2 type transport system permease protein